jgi:hypothetical protein
MALAPLVFIEVSHRFANFPAIQYKHLGCHFSAAGVSGNRDNSH